MIQRWKKLLKSRLDLTESLCFSQLQNCILVVAYPEPNLTSKTELFAKIAAKSGQLFSQKYPS